MKANLYVQGKYWATVDLPADGLLALLAKGIVSSANDLAAELQHTALQLGHVTCSISIRINEPPTFTPDPKAPPQEGTLP